MKNIDILQYLKGIPNISNYLLNKFFFDYEHQLHYFYLVFVLIL